MTLDELMGRYFRLKQELAIAYSQKPWHGSLIDRLASELSATEHLIVQQKGR